MQRETYDVRGQGMKYQCNNCGEVFDDTDIIYNCNDDPPYWCKYCWKNPDRKKIIEPK